MGYLFRRVRDCSNFETVFSQTFRTRVRSSKFINKDAAITRYIVKLTIGIAPFGFFVGAARKKKSVFITRMKLIVC